MDDDPRVDTAASAAKPAPTDDDDNNSDMMSSSNHSKVAVAAHQNAAEEDDNDDDEAVAVALQMELYDNNNAAHDDASFSMQHYVQQQPPLDKGGFGLDNHADNNNENEADDDGDDILQKAILLSLIQQQNNNNDEEIIDHQQQPTLLPDNDDDDDDDIQKAIRLSLMQQQQCPNNVEVRDLVPDNAKKEEEQQLGHDDDDDDDDDGIHIISVAASSLSASKPAREEDDDAAFTTASKKNERKDDAAAALSHPKYNHDDDDDQKKPAAKSDIMMDNNAVAADVAYSLSKLDRRGRQQQQDGGNDHYEEVVADYSTTTYYPQQYSIVASLPANKRADENDDDHDASTMNEGKDAVASLQKYNDDDVQKKTAAAKSNITTDAADASLSKQEINNSDLDMDVALALSLQAEDVALALSLQAEECDNNANGSPAMYGSVPGILQQVAAKAPEEVLGAECPAPNSVQSGTACWDLDEYLATEHSKEENEIAMNSTFCGKAYKFVESVANAYQQQIPKTNNSSNDVKAVTGAAAAADLQMKLIAVDDMLPMVERFAEAQSVFQVEGKNSTVDIGYHFTRSANLLHIQTTGLLSKCERREKGVENNYNGSAFGDGVYTGSNPHAYSRFGDIGLLVARLRGNSIPATMRGRGFKGDTGIVDEGSPTEMVILGQSFQCIPILQFQRHESMDGAALDKTIWTFHCMLQDIIDTFFNHGNRTGLDKAQPPSNWKGHAWTWNSRRT